MKSSLALDRMLMGRHRRSVSHGKACRDRALLCVAYSFSLVLTREADMASSHTHRIAADKIRCLKVFRQLRLAEV